MTNVRLEPRSAHTPDPDLLEACEAALASLSIAAAHVSGAENDPLIELLRAALRRARGEGDQK